MLFRNCNLKLIFLLKSQTQKVTILTNHINSEKVFLFCSDLIITKDKLK